MAAHTHPIATRVSLGKMIHPCMYVDFPCKLFSAASIFVSIQSLRMGRGRRRGRGRKEGEVLIERGKTVFLLGKIISIRFHININ